MTADDQGRQNVELLSAKMGAIHRCKGVRESKRNKIEHFVANRSVAKMLRNASSPQRVEAMDSSSMMLDTGGRHFVACGVGL
jgi:hypothetical protein